MSKDLLLRKSLAQGRNYEHGPTRATRGPLAGFTSTGPFLLREGPSRAGAGMAK